MSFKGGNVQGMRQIATAIGKAADIAQNFLRVAQATLDALSMAGPWAHAFKAYLRTLIQFLRRVIEALKAFVQILTKNADQQDQVSSRQTAAPARGGGSGGSGSGGGSPKSGSGTANKDNDPLSKLNSAVGKLSQLGDALNKFGQLFNQNDPSTQPSATQPAPQCPPCATPSTLDSSTAAPLPATGGQLLGQPMTASDLPTAPSPDTGSPSHFSGGGGNLGGGTGTGLPASQPPNTGELQIARTPLAGPEGAILAASGNAPQPAVTDSPIALNGSRNILQTAGAVLGATGVLTGAGLAARNALANREDPDGELAIQLGPQTLPS